MNEQVLIVQVFIQVAFLFGEVGRERRVEQGGAPGWQYGVSYLEHTHKNKCAHTYWNSCEETLVLISAETIK